MRLESFKNNKINLKEWTNEMPDKVGLYWFYGDRWNNGEIELHLVEVNMTGNNRPMYVASGNFMFKSELGSKYWFKSLNGIDLPE